MARYPGGCGVHLFDWKKTEGSLESRPEQQFGLPGFLLCCQAMGAVPLITLADYYGTAQDAADLVEYLNAPARPWKPWAQLRAKDGHSARGDVRKFEYSNETEHGDHQGRKTLPIEYSHNYLKYRSEGSGRAHPAGGGGGNRLPAIGRWRRWTIARLPTLVRWKCWRVGWREEEQFQGRRGIGGADSGDGGAHFPRRA